VRTAVERSESPPPPPVAARALALAVLFVLTLGVLVPMASGGAPPSPVAPSPSAPHGPALAGPVRPGSASLPVAPSEPGWPTPRGLPGQNASTPGYAPEVQPGTGTPPTLAQVSLGRWGGNATGLAVAPGGPVLVTLGNDTIYALNTSTLALEWWHNASQPLVGGPTVAGDQVFALGSAGKVFAWYLNGSKAWNYSTLDHAQGAAPLPWGGDLYVLTANALTVLNASTGAFLLSGPLDASTASSAPAAGAQELFAQAANGSAFLNAFSAFGQLSHAIRDSTSASGTTVYSDGFVAVAGASGGVNGGIVDHPGWFEQLPHDAATPVEPLAAGNGSVYATDGHGPLFSYTEAHGVPEWNTSPAWVSSAPSLAGSEVLVGANRSVEAFDSGTGAGLWQVATPGYVNSTLAIADGILYVLDSSGNLTALGTLPLSVLPGAARTVAAVGSPVTFTATPVGGVESVTATIDWLFSDGAMDSGAVVTHSFPSAGSAWAAAVAVDADGEVSPARTIDLTILPMLTVRLQPEGPTSGGAPLWLNLSVVPTGGAGAPWASISLQVTGAQPAWIDLSSYTADLTFTVVGTDQITAWVADSADDNSSSPTVSVIVLPSSPPAPTVAAIPGAPGTVEVVWTAAPVPGFEWWNVWVAQDGGALQVRGNLTQEGAGSFELTGVPLGANLSIEVSRSTTYGPTVFSSPVDLTTPLLPPTLAVQPAPGFPGQALLTWTIPNGASIDHFAHWDLLEMYPGAAAPTVVELPSYVLESNISYVTPFLPNGETVSLSLAAVLTNGSSVATGSEPFTPSYSFAQAQASIDHLEASLAWSIPSLPSFADVEICYAATVTGPWSCPLTVGAASSPSGGETLALPSPGDYVVNLTAYAANGFSVSASPIYLTATPVPAGPAWYATILYGLALWLWAILVLLLLVLVAIGYFLYRERTTIPPYLGEVLPWDPISPEGGPHAKPSSPETLEANPPLHRHRSSHPHRHLRKHGEAPEGTAATKPASDDDEDAEPQLRPPRRPPVKPTAVEEGPSEEEGRPAKARGAARIEQVGDEGEGADEEDEAGGKLTKLPVVLRHREDSEEEPAPSLLRAPPKRAPPPTSGKASAADEEDAGEDEGPSGKEAPAPPPRKPAPRPKSAADEEPTL
jgi:hypothetical protein